MCREGGKQSLWSPEQVGRSWVSAVTQGQGFLGSAEAAVQHCPSLTNKLRTKLHVVCGDNVEEDLSNQQPTHCQGSSKLLSVNWMETPSSTTTTTTPPHHHHHHHSTVAGIQIV
ncbi:hypothetical protein O3P69_016533 [Scylla paramamosain]|uniref:Uncharacterized protein n=1 Tax=Scylla paramamosain TaxID=85552 RepID=A0AAW0TGA1_SCYPA